jgi:hypothetical protein
MERPTVATRVGGMTGSILDRKPGVLINPSDPDSLAKGNLQLLHNPALARQHKKVGRERMFANFTLRRTVNGLLIFVSQVTCAARRVPSPYHRHPVNDRFLPLPNNCFALRPFDALLLPLLDHRWWPWRIKALRYAKFPNRMGLFRRQAFVDHPRHHNSSKLQ